MEQTPAMVQFDNIDLVLNERQVFDGLDFLVPQNKMTLLMGPSGVGKTTILRLITGQVEPKAGQVSVAGEPIVYERLASLYAMRKKIGMVFQSSALFPDLTVAENVALPVKEHRQVAPDVLEKLVQQGLEAVDLLDAYDLYPWQLSGGMQKRAALARASMLDPPLMLYDEPLAGQDPVTCHALLRLIKARNDGPNKTAVIVSHNIESMFGLVDHVVMLGQKRAIFVGSVAELFQCEDQKVQQFIQHCRWQQRSKG